LQSLLESHCTHIFVTGSQTGASPGHCALAVHVAMHVFVAVSQTGFDAGQSVPERHWTHLLFGTSQTVVAPVQAVLLVAVHCTQKSSGVLHAGAMTPGVQLASVVQPS